MANAKRKNSMPQIFQFRILTWHVFVNLLLFYGMKYGFALYLNSMRGPFGWLAIPLVCFPFLLLSVFGLIIFSAFAFLAYRQLKNLLTLLMICLTVVAGLFMPLPPIKVPVSPEELYFYEHQLEYEQVIELVSNGEQGSHDCRAHLPLPEDYVHLDFQGCVSTPQREQNGLILEFHPYDFYYPIHYVEFPDETYGFPCTYDGRVEKQLADNWFVCIREWN